jgi:uncharacterized protein (DUF2236 family)
MQNPPVYE